MIMQLKDQFTIFGTEPEPSVPGDAMRLREGGEGHLTF